MNSDQLPQPLPVAQPVALTIAGSDPSGGAGIQADLKTFHQLGCFGAAVVTLITAQNTCGVTALQLLDSELVVQQLRAVCDDLPITVAKTGALGSVDLARAVAEFWNSVDKAKRATAQLAGISAARPRLVVDPVLISKHGSPLAAPEMAAAICDWLVPLADVITPNRFEAERLTGIQVDSFASALQAARMLTDRNAELAVVIKQFEPGVDLIWYQEQSEVIESKWAATIALHGTGCAFSAAITANLAQGKPIRAAIIAAKHWVSAAISQSHLLGTGPVRPIFFHADTI